MMATIRRSVAAGSFRASREATRLPVIPATTITATCGQETSWVPRNAPAANTAVAMPLTIVASEIFTAFSRWMSPSPRRPSIAIIRMPMPAPK